MADTVSRSLLTHPDWPLLRPWVVIELYHRDGIREPRTRLELARDTPALLVARFAAITVWCARAEVCGRMIYPVQQRDGWGTFYLNVSCQQTLGSHCRNSGAARDAHDAIVSNLRQHPAPPAPGQQLGLDL